MEIVWSKLAKELLKSVLDYVIEQFGESIAQKTLEKIDSKVRQLALHPQIGIRDWSLTSTNQLQVRHLNISPNVVYYLIDDKTVVIIAIVHAKQSPENVRTVINKFLAQYGEND